MKHVVAIFMMLFVYVVVLAQVSSPSPSPMPVPVVPGPDVVSQITAWLESHMGVVGMVGVLLLNVVASVWPTAKPQNLFIWINAALAKLMALLKVLGDLNDKFLQNVKKG